MIKYDQLLNHLFTHSFIYSFNHCLSKTWHNFFKNIK